MTDILDIKSILSEYSNQENDFGFSTVSEEEYNSVIDTLNETVEQTADDYKKRLLDVEKLIIPFLMKLMSTSDKSYIYWPNRKPTIEAQIEKIINLTRG